MERILLRAWIACLALTGAAAQIRLGEDLGRTSDLGLSFSSGGCSSSPCKFATSNYPHVDGWPDSRELIKAVPNARVQAAIEPVGFNTTERVECSVTGIAAKNGAAAGLGKFFLVTSYESGCSPTAMAQHAAANGAAGLIVAAEFCLSSFGVGTVLPETFQTECAESYDAGVFGRVELESNVFLDHESIVTIPVIILARYEAYSLRECLDGSALFTDANCGPATSIVANFQWNKKNSFGSRFELWDSFANDRTLSNIFKNQFLDLVYPDLLSLSFAPSYFIETGVCTSGACTKQCDSGYCTRNLSSTYDMGGGDVLLEEMRRRFCMWEDLQPISADHMKWIQYIRAFENDCYLDADVALCARFLERFVAQLNVTTSSQCTSSFAIFLNEMDDPRRQHVSGGERALVLDGKIIYRDTDTGNELEEFNAIMATLCTTFGNDPTTPAISRACACSVEVDPIPDFDTLNTCFTRVIPSETTDDTALLASLGVLAAVGIAFSGVVLYRTRNFRKVTDEEKLFTREEALKMAQEFANQIMKDQKGEVSVKEGSMFDKE